MENAFLAAAKCQGCQEPECVKGCPAGIDIPGFLRRMEAKNYAGAARLIREKLPFGETCGLTCAADRLCQQNCYRREFTGKPVNIAELQQWVCKESGDEGWPRNHNSHPLHAVAVIGGGPAALSCAYYLTLAGCQVNVFAAEDQPGGPFLAKITTNEDLKTAFQRDVQGILGSGVTFVESQGPAREMDLKGILEQYSFVYVAKDQLSDQMDSGSLPNLDDPTPGSSTLLVNAEFQMNGMSLVEAAASGRKAALRILQSLKGV